MLPTRAIHSNTLATELRMDASVSTLVEDLESEAFTGSPEGCVFEMSESSMIVTGGCVKAPARCYYYKYKNHFMK